MITETIVQAHMRPRLVVMAPGEPYDPRTNSGVPSNLFPAMSHELEIVGTVSCLPTKVDQDLARLRSIAPTKAAWRSRYRMSMYQVHAAARAAERDLRTLGATEYDALFQIGTYCDISNLARKPTFAYMDHDLPSMVTIDARMRGTRISAHYVRRRLEHERNFLASAARVFTFSEWCSQRIAENYNIPPSLLECVGAGSNIPETLLASEPDYGSRHAVFIGLDFERKGGDQVLRAFSRLRSQLPSARLTVVGGMPPGDPAPGVHSTGKIRGADGQAKIAAILASASVFVMPSSFEPFGIAFIEAMAAGLPCIGGNSCAMPEIIGDTGEVVPPYDSDALARAMFDIMSDPLGCRERGVAARARYHERYGWKKVATRISGAIERSLERL